MNAGWRRRSINHCLFLVHVCGFFWTLSGAPEQRRHLSLTVLVVLTDLDDFVDMILLECTFHDYEVILALLEIVLEVNIASSPLLQMDSPYR